MNTKKIAYILISVLLFLIGFLNLLNYFKNAEFGLLNLDIRGNYSDLISTQSGVLLKGDTVTGKFHSLYPNLGLISVRFYNQDRDSDDILTFKLKEEGQENWYYEAQYKTDQFLPHKHFPFGFPIIKNSDGKNYEFQLESLRGSTESGILIDNKRPVFIAKSSYSKANLIADKKQLLNFIFNKITNVFGDSEIRILALNYYLPLIFFIIFFLTKGISYQLLTVLTLLFVCGDIFWLEDSYGYYIFSTILLWELTSLRFRFESKITATFALGLLAVIPVLMIFYQNINVEKVAVWVYLFLCITIIQQIYETIKHPQNLINLKEFTDRLLHVKIVNNSLAHRIYRRIYKPVAFSIIVYLLLKTHQRIIEAIGLYRRFFPNNYLVNFLYGTLLPFVIFLSISIFIFLTANKYFKSKLLLGLFIVLLTSFSFTKIIDKSTKFRNYSTIISISPNGVSEAWTDITLSGYNFRDKPFIGKVLINGLEQRVIDWTDTKVVFRTNPQITKSGMLEVVIDKGKKSNQYQFNYLFKY